MATPEEKAPMEEPMTNGQEVPPVVIKPDPDSLPSPLFTNYDESTDIDLMHFTQDDLSSIKKCVDNMKLIIKDYETQVDWHLQQYITLRNMATRAGRETSRADLDHLTKKGILSISHLNTLMNARDGNRNFTKRKTPAKNTSSKRRRQQSSEEEDSELDSEYDSELDDEFGEALGASEDEDDPVAKTPARKNKPRATAKRGRPSKSSVEVKDEIEEEYNELTVPKEEPGSDEEPLANFSHVSGKKGQKKQTPKKSKKAVDTIDLTMKTCSVVLNRVNEQNDAQ